eukprot:GFYU01011775.1.p1 GENE.GFYU01011775.1~~GFYU01011775.1.p1  ORF type:complete len:310 (+),score=103.60 GFYU01011775.1:278-1207(+)
MVATTTLPESVDDFVASMQPYQLNASVLSRQYSALEAGTNRSHMRPDKVKTTVEKLESTLQSAHALVESLQKTRAGERRQRDSTPEGHLEFLRVKEAAYAAHVQQLEQTQLSTLLEDVRYSEHPIAHQLTKEELIKTVVQLDITSDVATGQLQDTNRRYHDASKVLEELKVINEYLKNYQGDTQDTPAAKVTKVTKAIEQVRKSTAGVMEIFGSFLDDYYNEDRIEEHIKGSKKSKAAGGGKKRAVDKFMSLQDMLELLMNASLKKATDYCVMDHETFLEEYVELLVRAGIAQKHPNNSNLIRLIDVWK